MTDKTSVTPEWAAEFAAKCIEDDLPSAGRPSGQNVFHAHFDACKRCANNPFDLCAIGVNLLRAAALEPIK